MIDSTPRFFLIGKPQGITSFDVIRRLKPFFFELYGKGKGRHKLKVGHFGTLDPFADGLLLVGVGKSLKLTEFVHQMLSKEYVATGVVGKRTLTGDRDGEIVETLSAIPGSDEIKKSLQSFIGKYNQRPSYFSAVKHEGKPLYEYARQGVFIDKDPVERTIYKCDFIEMVNDEARFCTSVSTGTYIRKLWEDTCEKCNNIGHLIALRRTRIGDLELSKAIWLDDVKSATDLIPYGPMSVLNFKQALINDIDKKYILQGREINLSESDDLLWLVDQKDCLVALVKHIGKGKFRSQINFMDAT